MKSENGIFDAEEFFERKINDLDKLNYEEKEIAEEIEDVIGGAFASELVEKEYNGDYDCVMIRKRI